MSTTPWGAVPAEKLETRFVNLEQLQILKLLFTTQAVSYHHLSTAARVEADALVARGVGYASLVIAD